MGVISHALCSVALGLTAQVHFGGMHFTMPLICTSPMLSGKCDDCGQKFAFFEQWDRPEVVKQYYTILYTIQYYTILYYTILYYTIV